MYICVSQYIKAELCVSSFLIVCSGVRSCAISGRMRGIRERERERERTTEGQTERYTWKNSRIDQAVRERHTQILKERQRWRGGKETREKVRARTREKGRARVGKGCIIGGKGGRKGWREGEWGRWRSFTLTKNEQTHVHARTYPNIHTHAKFGMFRCMHKHEYVYVNIYIYVHMT